jgi:hypothetical protein
LWVALGATVSTGIYGPGEALVMAAPLGAAAVVEAFRWDLSHRHRWIEVGALLFFLADLARGHGLFVVALQTLFVLAGARLVLPREPSHRRQLLLIGFLLFLATAIATSDLLFLVWTILWSWAAALALLQQSWEPSASLRRGVSLRPPYRRVPLWVGTAMVLGAGFFLILPRLSLGLRPRAVFGLARPSGQAGLDEQLDLSTGGVIQPNPEVAIRIAPPMGVDPVREPQWSQGLALLRGVTLEAAQGLRWEPSAFTPRLAFSSGSRRAEFFFAPTPHGLLALPLGLAWLEPFDLPLAPGPGGSVRWRSPSIRSQPITVVWNPSAVNLQEPTLSPRRLALLTRLGPQQEAARRASFRLAPDILATPALAQRLEAALQRFTYTLDNPSGQAANPLQDFLERTHAGHCEYFASALALMLRARGVPARVVNGYRLGPWIPEGGYFRVSQNEAHSWVEYWHEGRWWTADPTPQALTSAQAGNRELGPVQRWLDALRYRWDRHVVRFSDQDQQAGLSWLQGQLQNWEWRWKAPPRSALVAVGALAFSWVLWRTRSRWEPKPLSPGRVQALRPLRRATRTSAPPAPGESARGWLLRLATVRPERAEALVRLAHAVDAEAYGPGQTSASTFGKAEAKAWRGWKPTS